MPDIDSRARESRTRCLLLGAILIAAAALRFPGVTHAGILSVDEGRYLLDGLSAQSEMGVVADLFRGKLGEMQGHREFLLEKFLPEARERLSRHAPFLPKVLFSWLIAIAFACFGFNVWAGNVIEAAFGVLMVWLTYIYLRRVRSPRAGLIAAGLLALSCHHTYFSRNTYPQCISAFFFLLALLMHFEGFRETAPGGPRLRWPLLSGLCAGLSFLANFQAGGALPVLALVHLLASLRAPSWREKIQRAAGGGLALAAGFFGALLAAEATSYPLILLFRSQGLVYPHDTFFELLAPRMGLHTRVPANWQGVVLYPYFALVFEGALTIAACALLGGLGVWARLRGGSDRPEGSPWPPAASVWLYLGVAALVPWALFSFKTLQGARTFVFILPFLFGLVAVAADEALTVSRRAAPRTAVAVLLILTGGSMLWHDLQILRIRSAYPEALRAVVRAGGSATAASWWSVLACYLEETGLQGGCYYDYIAAGQEPPRHFIADWQELYFGHYPDEPLAFPGGAAPAEVLHHQFGTIFLRVELFPAYSPTFQAIQEVEALDLDRARALCIYDLADLRTGSPVEPPPNSAQPGL